MKILLLIASLVFVSAAQSQESAKIYHGIAPKLEAVVTIVPVPKSKFYFIHYAGFEHEIDGVARLYEKHWYGASQNEGAYYQLLGVDQINIKDNNETMSIHGGVAPLLDVLLVGNEPIKAVYFGKSTLNNNYRIITSYQKRQGITRNVTLARSAIEKAQHNFLTSCGTAIELDIEWESFERKGMKSTPSMLQNHINILAELCAENTAYKDPINKILSIKLLPSQHGDHAIALNGGVLSVKFDRNSPNIPEAALEIIRKVL